MTPILYIDIPQNVTVYTPHIYLQDIAALACNDPNVLNQIRLLPIHNFSSPKNVQYIMNSTELLTIIHKKIKNITVNFSGETSFIINYHPEDSVPFWKWCKICFICLATFFGSAFSIMTFNNDVDTGKLFSQIHMQLTGKASNGFSPLEISYSLGIGLGVIFFHNHFGKIFIKKEPTPMEIQMHTYEQDASSTLIDSSKSSSK